MKFWRGAIGAGGTRLSNTFWFITARPETTNRVSPIRGSLPGDAIGTIVGNSYFDAATGGATTYTYAGSIAITSTVSGAVSKGKVSQGSIAAVLNVLGSYNKSKSFGGDIPIVSGVAGLSNKSKSFSGTIAITSTVPGVYSFESAASSTTWIYSGSIDIISGLTSSNGKGKIINPSISREILSRQTRIRLASVGYNRRGRRIKFDLNQFNKELREFKAYLDKP